MRKIYIYGHTSGLSSLASRVYITLHDFYPVPRQRITPAFVNSYAASSISIVPVSVLILSPRLKSSPRVLPMELKEATRGNTCRCYNIPRERRDSLVVPGFSTQFMAGDKSEALALCRLFMIFEQMRFLAATSSDGLVT